MASENFEYSSRPQEETEKQPLINKGHFHRQGNTSKDQGADPVAIVQQEDEDDDDQYVDFPEEYQSPFISGDEFMPLQIMRGGVDDGEYTEEEEDVQVELEIGEPNYTQPEMI